MLKSRKLFNALAMTGLLTLGSVSSFAQQTCTTTATNSNLRPEGVTEIIGDVNVTCVGNLPPNFSILVQLPANFVITNGAPTTASAPQLINSGAPTAPVVTYPATLTNAVNFEVAGATTNTFTITGIRANVANAIANGFPTSGQVQAALITNVPAFIQLTNPNPIVGTVLPVSLGFGVVAGSDANTAFGVASLASCVNSPAGGPAGVVVSGFFRFSETFSNVLRLQAGASGEDGNVAGSATTATQLRISLANLPANAVVYVPNGNIATGRSVLAPITVSGISPTATYGTTANPVLAYEPYAGDAFYTGTYGQATGTDLYYSVSATDPNAIETLTIPFIVQFTGGPSVGIGTATAKGTLAPLASASPTAFPRFVDVGQSGNAFTTTICSTTLLFPYVTTDAGFDTGIAIANTTADPAAFGTANQSGTCAISAYGAYGSGTGTVPAAGTSPAIAAGRTWAFSLTDSGVFADSAKLGSGFSGYLITQCNFQLAHGYAFISTYGLAGSNAVAQGYLALVLDRNSGSRVLGATIESLGN